VHPLLACPQFNHALAELLVVADLQRQVILLNCTRYPIPGRLVVRDEDIRLVRDS
jgi:hypothetical protein